THRTKRYVCACPPSLRKISYETCAFTSSTSPDPTSLSGTSSNAAYQASTQAFSSDEAVPCRYFLKISRCFLISTFDACLLIYQAEWIFVRIIYVKFRLKKTIEICQPEKKQGYCRRIIM